MNHIKTTLLTYLLLSFAFCNAQNDSNKSQPFNPDLLKKSMQEGSQHKIVSNDSAAPTMVTHKNGKVFSVYSDLALDAYDEANIGAEYEISHLITVGAAFSIVFPGVFKNSATTFWDTEWPATIYNGYGIRAYCKTYVDAPTKDKDGTPIYNPAKKSRIFFSFQADFKDEYYSNTWFADKWEYSGDYRIWTEKSADTRVFDFNILFGKEFSLANNRFFFEYSYGFGCRLRLAHENVLASYVGIDQGQINTPTYFLTQLGIVDTKYIYPYPMFGFKVGINIGKVK